jgi:hypothetical protein
MAEKVIPNVGGLKGLLSRFLGRDLQLLRKYFFTSDDKLDVSKVTVQEAILMARVDDKGATIQDVLVARAEELEECERTGHGC